MTILRRTLITGIVALLCVGATGTASAQQRAAIADLEIALWPEYDRPSVLVIYRAELRSGTPLPATVRFQIPTSAGAPSAVAEQQLDGRLTNVGHRRSVDGETSTIEMTISQLRFQLEYYDPGIDLGDSPRTFGFTFLGEQVADAVHVVVQHPAGSRALTTDPAAVASDVGGDGLLYSEIELGPVSADEAIGVEVSYEKDTDTLTADGLAPAPQASAPQQVTLPPGARARGETSPWVWVISTFVAIVLGAGAWSLWNRSRQPSRAQSSPARGGGSQRRRKGSGQGAGASKSTADRSRRSGRGDKRRSGGGSGARSGPAAARFCTQCGASAGADDRFCHSCGQALGGA